MAKKPTYEELERKVEELEEKTINLQKTEEALRESEEKYRTILGSIDEAYFEVDLKGRFTFFNNSLTKIILFL